MPALLKEKTEHQKTILVVQAWSVSGLKSDGTSFNLIAAKSGHIVTREQALELAAKRFPGCTVTEDHEVREEKTV